MRSLERGWYDTSHISLRTSNPSSKKFPNHSWQSLKEHFLKKIYPLLHSYKMLSEALAHFRKGITSESKNRRGSLSSFYCQVPVHFADLHDTPERMLEKGCISEIVPGRKSCKTLFWRLKRVLLENQILNDLTSVKSDLSDGQAKAMLRRWFMEDQGATEGYKWENNEAMAGWLESQLNSSSIVARNIGAVKQDAVVQGVKNSVESCPEAAVDAVVEMVRGLNAQQRAQVLQTLSQQGEDQQS